MEQQLTAKQMYERERALYEQELREAEYPAPVPAEPIKPRNMLIAYAVKIALNQNT